MIILIMRHRLVKLIPLVAVGAVGILFGYLFYSNLPTQSNSQPTEETPTETSPDDYHVTTILETEFFDEAIEDAYDFGTRAEARVWVLPHHLVPRPLIAGFLEAQTKTKKSPTIFIVGPDHLSRASAPIVTSDKRWRTPYGFVEINKEYIEEMTAGELVEIDHEVFGEEHSVSALIPLVHHYFPESKIVPILVREDVSPEARYAVADMLADDGTVMIASVDFSHYLPSDIAEFHDERSLRALENRSYSDLPELEIDSAPTLAMAFDFAEQTASEEFEFYYREDSDAFFGYPVYETTSYIFGGYTYEDQEKTAGVSVLAMGDLMFSRNYTDEFTDPFGSLAGEEQRFFIGHDILVANLEGTIAAPAPPEKTNDFAFKADYANLLATYNFSAVSLANNHSLDQGEAGYQNTLESLATVGVGYFGHQEQEVAEIYKHEVDGKVIEIIGVNLVEQEIDELLIEQVITTAESQSDYQVVMVHWGEEFSPAASEAQKEWGRKLVDWGADAVIGSHPHVIQGMEVYQNVPIVYSLGNTVFDQVEVPESNDGLLAGVIFRDMETDLYLFPVTDTNSQPKLATTTREGILEYVAKQSSGDSDLLSVIKRGIVRLPKN